MEFLYTRFINLITSEPSIRTILPLKEQGKEDTTTDPQADRQTDMHKAQAAACGGSGEVVKLRMGGAMGVAQVSRTRPTRSSPSPPRSDRSRHVMTTDNDDAHDKITFFSLHEHPDRQS